MKRGNGAGEETACAASSVEKAFGESFGNAQEKTVVCGVWHKHSDSESVNFLDSDKFKFGVACV